MQNKLSPVLLGMITNETDASEIDSYDDLLKYIHQSLDTLREFSKEKIQFVTSHEIAAVISNKTGIPIGKIQSQEKERLLNMEEILKRRVVGQDHALKALVDAILESRSGLNKQGQPIGSFFFLGPTGTGKTELAKAMAEALFNDEKAIIRFDMSEFPDAGIEERFRKTGNRTLYGRRNHPDARQQRVYAQIWRPSGSRHYQELPAPPDFPVHHRRESRQRSENRSKHG